MSKKPRGLDGVGPIVAMPSYDEAKHYDVTLKSTVEYPPGSRRFIAPGAYVELRGSVINLIKEHVLEAREVPWRKIDHAEPRAKTNVASLKHVAVR